MKDRLRCGDADDSVIFVLVLLWRLMELWLSSCIYIPGDDLFLSGGGTTCCSVLCKTEGAALYGCLICAQVLALMIDQSMDVFVE